MFSMFADVSQRRREGHEVVKRSRTAPSFSIPERSSDLPYRWDSSVDHQYRRQQSSLCHTSCKDCDLVLIRDVVFLAASYPAGAGARKFLGDE